MGREGCQELLTRQRSEFESQAKGREEDEISISMSWIPQKLCRQKKKEEEEERFIHGTDSRRSS